MSSGVPQRLSPAPSQAHTSGSLELLAVSPAKEQKAEKESARWPDEKVETSQKQSQRAWQEGRASFKK